MSEKRIETDHRVTLSLTWLKPADMLAPICGDRHKFGRALSNFVNNAIEASADGQTIEVRIDQNLANDKIVIQILDHGVGMEPGTVCRLGKEEFTDKKKHGTGIGFLWSKNEIESIGGSVSVSSQRGAGTTVTVSIPAATQTPDVIYIDDNIYLQQVWKAAAMESGKTIHCYSSMAEWSEVDVCKLPKATLFYIDVDLGDGNSGLEIAKILLTRGFHNVHLATGHNIEDLPTEDLANLVSVSGKHPPKFV